MFYKAQSLSVKSSALNSIRKSSAMAALPAGELTYQEFLRVVAPRKTDFHGETRLRDYSCAQAKAEGLHKKMQDGEFSWSVANLDSGAKMRFIERLIDCGLSVDFSGSAEIRIGFAPLALHAPSEKATEAAAAAVESPALQFVKTA